jgi:predicted small secreted protein
MVRRFASVLSIAALVGLAACSNTWDGFKKDMDKTGKEIEEETDDI